MKKISVLTGIAVTATLLSGCSLDDITGEETETSTATQSPVATTDEISDAAFEKAFAKYLKENPIKFGTQLDDAYKIYQADAQKKQLKEQEKKDEERNELIKKVKDISDADHIAGNKNAEFVLFEYSDYHCPYCKRFHVTTKEFIEKNSNVAVVFRAYPAVHKTTAQPIHEAAECVAKESGNEAFWRFSDNVFATQFRKGDIKAKLDELKIANSEKIMKCYADGEFKTLVDESAQEAVSLGIQGTPGSILKNIKTGEVVFINGAQPLSALEAAKKELSEIK
ncbi:TPA: DsbA family protein [Candidatus Peregrinibacteria bacterium]|nr:DsbA family protein [Candidatus Peregrinibacteria bacterium]